MCGISTHTLRGERDRPVHIRRNLRNISTHTLRGERDDKNSVSYKDNQISTHTLRGERDMRNLTTKNNIGDFNSHAPWGA